MKTRSLLVGAVALAASAASLSAQDAPAAPGAPTQAVAAETFSFEIGRVAREGAVYTIDATQPATSKLTGQKVRLTILETADKNTTTRYFSLATGKHKTVAQLDAILAEIFGRFLATPAPAPGQELGKIGDVKYGGEVRFVAASPDVLRFDSIAPNEPVHPSSYSRADVGSLLAVLTGGTSR